MSTDPYATPAASAVYDPQAANSAITQGVVQQLARTKPWVRLVSVMMFIGAGLMLLIGLVMLVAGASLGSRFGNDAFPAGMGVIFAVVYMVMAVFYIYPALKLWKYASRIGDLLRSGHAMDLEAALNEQRSFWKFVGVIIVVFLSLYAVAFVIMVVAGGIGAFAGKQ